MKRWKYTAFATLVVAAVSVVAILVAFAWRGIATRRTALQTIRSQGGLVRHLSVEGDSNAEGSFSALAYSTITGDPDLRPVESLVLVKPRDVTMALNAALEIPDLSDLTIEDAELSDKSVAAIGKMQSLRSLTLYRVTLSRADLSTIGVMEGLQALRLIEMGLDGDDVGFLAELHDLKELELSNNAIDDSGIAEVTTAAFARNLKSLRLDRCDVTDTGVRDLVKNCRNLATLDLSGTDVCGTCFSELAGLPELRILNIGDLENLRNDCLDELAGAHSLREIDLSRSNLSSEHFVSLIGLTGLEKLSLNGVFVSASFQGPTSIIELQMQDCEIADEAMQQISMLPLLVHLDLEGASVSDEQLAILKHAVSLKSLNIAGTDTTAKALDAFVAHPALQVIWAMRTNIDQTAVERFLVKRADVQSMAEIVVVL